MIRVVTSQQSAAHDARTIGDGVPSRALMQRAGAAAAAEILIRFRERAEQGVLVLAGPGNNGGDAWVVARALAASGARVRVVEPLPAKTPDAVAERALAQAALGDDAVVAGAPRDAVDRGEGIVVDGLLGTGSQGAPRGPIADLLRQAAAMRARGALIVALDVPSGLDATTGDASDGVCAADLTVTFGSIKRGQLVARQLVGTLVAVDIGLAAADSDDVPRLVDDRWAAAHVPPIPVDAHKGIRKKLAIVGGAAGMAGAAALAAEAALRSGIGMVKVVVASESLPAIQERQPYALAASWPSSDDEVARTVSDWADAVVIGPGLGRDAESRALLERVLRVWNGPTLLDADALTMFAGRAPELGAVLGKRPALVTPHPVEFARLAGAKVEDVLAHRFDIGQDLARTLGSAVLLKGVPTVIFAPSGERLVSATGTPALATGGSGDVLSGVTGTLLAQIGDPFAAGALGAYVHGRAAERVPSNGGVRGISLDDVVRELRHAWDFSTAIARYPVLAELATVA